MIVCIDSGNTRIKWGVHAAGRWLAQGAVLHAELADLAGQLRHWQPKSVLLANVAGPTVAAGIHQALRVWKPLISEVKAGAAYGDVSNGYENPERLGVDRWCALLGARGLTAKPCLVVMAGTATTIDTLDGTGRFLGGLILPGVDLMRRSLASDTAALPLAQGQHATYPRNTDDAIVSGCLEAQAGAIERAYARIVNEPEASCLLSGGAASGRNHVRSGHQRLPAFASFFATAIGLLGGFLALYVLVTPYNELALIRERQYRCRSQSGRRASSALRCRLPFRLRSATTFTP
jgi:type III pantothenate kinase